RTAMNAESHRVVVVLDHRLLPGLAPGGSSRRDRLVFNRTPVAVDGPDIGSADEPEAAVVEVVRREVVDHGPGCAGGHEGIDDDVLIEECCNRTRRLVGIV